MIVQESLFSGGDGNLMLLLFTTFCLGKVCDEISWLDAPLEYANQVNFSRKIMNINLLNLTLCS